MFGFGRARIEATEAGAAAARTAIMPFLGWDRDGNGAFDSRIWCDPFVLGLIHGVVGPQTLPVTGRKLSTTDKGRVMFDAMRTLGASREAFDYSLTLAASHDPEFTRGRDTAFIAILLAVGTLEKEAYSEPDIVAAKEFMPMMRRLNRETALAGVSVSKLDENQELGLAYIFLKVQGHKEAHYPSLD